MTKSLVIHDDVTNSLEALDPKNATGLPLPAFTTGTALPAAGQVVGEGFMNTATRTGYIWDGTRWQPIVPSALLNYPNDAAVLADRSQSPGSYATSQATGNLFISMAGGVWHQVGVRSYATEAGMKADLNALEGDTAWTQDTNQLWYFNAGKWFTLGVHYYATEADMIADAANAPGGGLACASDTSLMFTMPTTAGTTWQPMSIAQFATEADMRAKTTNNIAHQIAITQDQNRIYVWTGTAWIGSPVEYFATEAALLAATPPAGVLAVAGDTSKAYVKTATGWNGLAGPTMTAGTALPTSGMATGDMFYNITTKTLYVRGSSTWDAVSGGATFSATAPATPQTGQLWYDTATRTLKTWSGSAWYSSGVWVYATNAAFIADTSAPDGVIAVDNEYGVAYLRGGGNWKPFVPWLTTTAGMAGTHPNFAGALAVTTDKGELFVGANNKWNNIGAGPKLVGKKAISHHMYQTNTWETTTYNIPALTTWIPLGNIFKLEIVASGVSYHGGDFEVRSSISGWGGTTSLHRELNDGDNTSAKSLYHAVSGTSGAGITPVVSIQSSSNQSNADRVVQGYILLWDLGAPANIPDLT